MSAEGERERVIQAAINGSEPAEHRLEVGAGVDLALHRIESSSACGSVVVHERSAEDDAGSGGRHVADPVPVLPHELAHKSTHGVILGKFPPLDDHRIVSGLTTDLFKCQRCDCQPASGDK
jgi:hypothetical protein